MSANEADPERLLPSLDALATLPIERVVQVDRAFAAVADPIRRAVLERLGQGSATITELAEPFGMSLTRDEAARADDGRQKEQLEAQLAELEGPRRAEVRPGDRDGDWGSFATATAPRTAVSPT